MLFQMVLSFASLSKKFVIEKYDLEAKNDVLQFFKREDEFWVSKVGDAIVTEIFQKCEEWLKEIYLGNRENEVTQSHVGNQFHNLQNCQITLNINDPTTVAEFDEEYESKR